MVNIKKNQIKPIFIAEVGQNHQGSLKKALEYVRVFSKLGAHIIKFQNRNNKYLFSTEAFKKDYFSVNSFAKTYGKHREKLELSYKDLKKIKFECKKNGVEFMSTPFDEPSVELLKKLKLNFVKISSFEIGNLPFINLIGKKFKTVFISTGGANIDQIKQSIKILRKNKVKIILMHCVSIYPTPAKKTMLDTIAFYKDKFGCPVGFSDHSSDISLAIGSVALGANVIEKHFTVSDKWPGPDIPISLTPKKFKLMVESCKEVFDAKGIRKNVLKEEIPVTKFAFASVVTIKDISIREKFTEKNLWVKRPGTGKIPAKEIFKIFGKRSTKNLKKDKFLGYLDFK